MMGEENPRQLLDFDNYLLRVIEGLGPVEPQTLSERVGDAIREWSESQREDLYGLSPEELRDSLIKLEDLSFRDGVRVALEDPHVMKSMFVLLKSGNIDYRKGAIFTLEEIAKRDIRAVDRDLLHDIVTGPFTQEERIMLIENSTEFGRVLGRMILEDETRDAGDRFIRELSTSGEDTQLRLALKAFTHLSKVAPERVQVPLVVEGLGSGNDFNRETAARVIQNLAKNAPQKVTSDVLVRMAADTTWSVRQVTSNAIANLWRHDREAAENVLVQLESSGNDEQKKVAEGARKIIDKKRR